MARQRRTLRSLSRGDEVERFQVRTACQAQAYEGHMPGNPSGPHAKSKSVTDGVDLQPDQSLDEVQQRQVEDRHADKRGAIERPTGTGTAATLRRLQQRNPSRRVD